MAALDPNPNPELVRRRAWYQRNKRRLNELRAAERSRNRTARKSKADSANLYLRRYWRADKGYGWQMVMTNPQPGDVEFRRVGIVHGPLAAPRHEE